MTIIENRAYEALSRIPKELEEARRAAKPVFLKCQDNIGRPVLVNISAISGISSDDNEIHIHTTDGRIFTPVKPHSLDEMGKLIGATVVE